MRDCFRACGVDAVSCDLEECERGEPHVKKCALEVAFSQYWDGIICFPPCTRLSNVAARFWRTEREAVEAAAVFAVCLASAPCGRLCLENPWLNSHWRPASQEIEPFQFGHVARKRTCLWLKNLPCLVPTWDRSAELVKRGRKRVYLEHRERDAFERARTWSGVAEAMASQWSGLM